MNDSTPEYRCTGCGWVGDYDEIEHLRTGEDILDRCPGCESVESMALNDPAPGCQPRAFVTRTCERGVVGCDILHDHNPTLEQVFDKLHEAGVVVLINVPGDQL